MHRIISALLVLYFPFCSLAKEISYFQGDERYRYEVELLAHVLKLTEEEYGPAQIKSLEFKTDLNGLKALINGQVDVAFLPTSKRHESNLLAIKTPLLQGMLGYRLLLVKKDKVIDFQNISSLEQLKQNTVAGFGLHWEDLRVLYHNRLPVIANANYPELFELLDREQVDYLPRGLNEVYKELENQKIKYPKLTLVPDLALYYPIVRYFFVRRENSDLARRLESGLEKAKADGSFRKLFDKHFSDVIKRHQNQKPRIIKLSNPFLPGAIPNLESDWWMKTPLP